MNSASQAVRDAAKALERLAAHFPEASDVRAPLFSYPVDGNFVVRCKPNRSAVLALAKRLAKAPLTHTISTPELPSMRRGWNSATFEQFLRDDEIENAINYAEANGKPILFSKGANGHPDRPLVKVYPIKGREGFVAARVYARGKLSEWDVYHIVTGCACSSASTDRAGAILKFETIPRDALDQAVARANIKKPV